MDIALQSFRRSSSKGAYKQEVGKVNFETFYSSLILNDFLSYIEVTLEPVGLEASITTTVGKLLSFVFIVFCIFCLVTGGRQVVI